MPETSVTFMAETAVIPILISGWAASVVLFSLGSLQRKAVFVGYGILLAGIMVLVTSTVLFLAFLPEVGGGYRVTAGEILTFGLLGFLGGALAMLGASYVTIAARGTARAGQR